MKKLSLMMAFVAIVATAINANNYFPQQGKEKETKSQTVKVKRPAKKKVRVNTSAPVEKETKKKVDMKK